MSMIRFLASYWYGRFRELTQAVKGLARNPDSPKLFEFGDQAQSDDATACGDCGSKVTATDHGTCIRCNVLLHCIERCGKEHRSGILCSKCFCEVEVIGSKFFQVKWTFVFEGVHGENDAKITSLPQVHVDMFNEEGVDPEFHQKMGKFHDGPPYLTCM